MKISKLRVYKLAEKGIEGQLLIENERANNGSPIGKERVKMLLEEAEQLDQLIRNEERRGLK